jgi:hypothetical protein
MLKNIGGAVGPVVATTITNSCSITIPGVPISLPTSTAFYCTFYLGVASMVAVLIFSLATKNYVFRKQALPSQTCA